MTSLSMLQMAYKIEQLEARNKTLASELKTASMLRDQYLFEVDDLTGRLQEAEKGIAVIDALRSALA